MTIQCDSINAELSAVANDVLVCVAYCCSLELLRWFVAVLLSRSVPLDFDIMRLKRSWNVPVKSCIVLAAAVDNSKITCSVLLCNACHNICIITCFM